MERAKNAPNDKQLGMSTHTTLQVYSAVNNILNRTQEKDGFFNGRLLKIWIANSSIDRI